jgi:hypothetical protein
MTLTNDPSNPWVPTPLEFFTAMVALSTMPQVNTPAIFIHGSPVKSDKLDELLCEAVVGAHKFGQKIVLNGLTAKMCSDKNLAYRGHEVWEEMLHGKINPDNIILLPASGHTGAESKNLIALAEQNSWDSITIASYPHHILRCILQFIALAPKDNLIKINPLTFKGISWNQQLVKPVMDGKTVGGGGDVYGTLTEHAKEEFDRIVMYAQEPGNDDNGNPKFTRNATIPELFDYLKLVG